MHSLVIYIFVDLINAQQMGHIGGGVSSEVFKVAGVEYSRLLGYYAVLTGT